MFIQYSPDSKHTSAIRLRRNDVTDFGRIALVVFADGTFMAGFIFDRFIRKSCSTVCEWCL